MKADCYRTEATVQEMRMPQFRFPTEPMWRQDSSVKITIRSMAVARIIGFVSGVPLISATHQVSMIQFIPFSNESQSKERNTHFLDLMLFLRSGSTPWDHPQCGLVRSGHARWV